MNVARASEAVDPLSDLVRLLNPRPSAFKRFSGASRWAVSFNGGPGLDFGTVTRGRCLVSGAFGTLEAKAGDVVLLSSPVEFRVGSDLDTLAVPGPHEPVAPAAWVVPVGTGPEQDRVLVGRYNLATANAELLTTLLPAVWHVRSGEQGVETVSALVDLLVAEVIRPRPGSELIIERLAELVLIEVMRLTASSPASAPTGLLQGLSDPVLAVALRAMHADVARDWSIADLARTAVVSRSVFAARFAQTIGMTPMAYLLTWRMALAKEAIVRADRSHTQIALAVGYSSVSAFSTAFKRHVGRSPARFASGVRSAANGSSLPGS